MEHGRIYDIGLSPGKGLGIFSNRPLAKGTRLLCEKPILSAPRERGTIDIADVFSRFSRLSWDEQQDYLRLHAAQVQFEMIFPSTSSSLPRELREQVAKVVSIFETNAFEVHKPAEDPVSGVCLVASRVNHSCCPNAGQTWNGILASLTIHAVKDIAVNEEITIPYVFPTLELPVRQLQLKGYDFSCTCAACDNSDWQAPIYDLRRKICRLNRNLDFFVAKSSLFGKRVSGPLTSDLVDAEGNERPLKAVRKLTTMLAEAGLTGHELLKWYDYAARYNSYHFPDKEKETLAWAHKALEVEVDCQYYEPRPEGKIRESKILHTQFSPRHLILPIMMK